MLSRVRRLRDIVHRVVQYATGSFWNKFSRRPITGDAPVVVSLTSHGSRLSTVHHTIESIAAGAIRPRRLILTLDSPEDASAARSLRTLARLRGRGLEILEVPRMGPHAKYYPYVVSIAEHPVPLVTADDDIIYPRNWLAELTAAHRRQPDLIHCLRAHAFGIQDGKPAPYSTWKPASTRRPSYSTFLTGVSGVIYPPAFLDQLREAGDAFRAVSPKADDVWLHAQALTAQVRVAQIHETPRTYPVLLGTQLSALWRHNTHGPVDSAGGAALRTPNDEQIERTYSQELFERIINDVNAPANGETSSDS